MLLSDVLDAVVRDRSGRRIGYVVDARLVLDSPPAPTGLLAGARLHGLVVGPRHAGSFLGYERTDIRAPALVARWLRRRHAGAFLVLWADVLEVPDPQDADRPGRDRTVVLHEGFTRYDPALPAAAR